MGGLLLLVLACAPAPLPPEEEGAPRLVVEQAVLRAGEGLTLRAARATVDDLGAGQGSQVQAELRAPAADPQAPGAGAPARPPLQITAPASDWDLRTRSVRFQGGVTATRGAVTLTCQELEVRYASADQVDTATARGQVQVVHGARTARADQAVLTAADGALTLTGQPQLTEGPNTLSGQRIVLWLDDERVRCDDCRLVVAGTALGAD
ncbi:LptA/OstA family protein [Myxococcota bacterium]|nr:LptA/OstA family protein [Myxococcota bacterium]